MGKYVVGWILGVPVIVLVIRRKYKHDYEYHQACCEGEKHDDDHDVRAQGWRRRQS